MYTTKFWKGLGERALKTFVQVGVTMVVATQGTEAIGVDAGITDVSWLTVLNVSALATLLSVATSFVDSSRTSQNAGEEAWQLKVPGDGDTEDGEVDMEDAEDEEYGETEYSKMDAEADRINAELGNE